MLGEATSIDINRIQYIAITGSLLFIALIFWLIRQRHIREKYALLWLLISAAFLAFSLWRKGLDYVSLMIGISYPPAMILLALVLSLFLLSLQFSVIVSRLSERQKTLVQEIALLRREVEELREKMNSTHENDGNK